ncbi:MAG: hypothetical protein BWZ02_01965 [Lentisphaerae bacterium ADurb.BinA184]|nr:MAG: hypothetical protein BWZ02_01965 [Lentisphaerae bacterium ADurb.BinA184]
MATTNPGEPAPPRLNRNHSIARLHRQTLVEMNTSVFTARRDAAHERVQRILRRDMRTSKKGVRVRLYQFCARLLDEAAQCTRRSQVQADSPVLHYLNLLRGTLASAQALTEHELRLAREREALSKTLDDQALAQLQAADDVFSTGEMNVLDRVDELLTFGEPILARDTEGRRKVFSPEDLTRYDKALAEYRRVHEKRLAGVRSHPGQPAQEREV